MKKTYEEKLAKYWDNTINPITGWKPTKEYDRRLALEEEREKSTPVELYLNDLAYYEQEEIESKESNI
tara:strand:+ start:588 stop:791 length:204 start_codon:yes stop_codon:yes gene_type:complete